MTTMRAARLIAAGEPLSIDDVELPTPGPGELLVEVRACGLCGTDVHLAVVGDLPVQYLPITLGHEAAGVVVGCGPGVVGIEAGARVAMFPAAWCGTCRFCLAGRQSLCERSEVYGMARDGALAEYMVVPARTVIPVPDGIPFDVAAIVADGVATPFHALRSRGRLVAGEAVGVFGCGGLGTHAIQLARMMGAAQIIAVDTDAHALQRATRLGADFTFDPSAGDTARGIRALGGLDLALEFIGLAETVELAVKSLATAGRAVVVGVGTGRPSLPPLAAFVGREQAVLGSFGMDRADIVDLYDLIAAGRLDLSESVTARYPLAEANAALEHLAGKSAGDSAEAARSVGVVRVVVEP